MLCCWIHSCLGFLPLEEMLKEEIYDEEDPVSGQGGYTEQRVPFEGFLSPCKTLMWPEAMSLTTLTLGCWH